MKYTNIVLAWLLWVLPGMVFAEQTHTPCPIPYQHMKTNYFNIADHEAITSLKSNATQFQWTIYIRTRQLIISPSVIDSFLRMNKYQEYAYTTGGLGGSKYRCKYLSPWTGAEFFATSNG